MTSNLGSEIIHENFDHIDETELETIMEKSRLQVFELLKRTMRPEFLNRIDELVMFRPLTRDHLNGIIEIQLGHLARILKKQDITFEAHESLFEYLKKEGYDLQYGARPLKRLVQKKLLDQLALAMLQEKVKPGMHIQMKVEDHRIVFVPLDR
jgi:ATP-dependent Clp protease ATP-binding subunit ClpB